MIMGLNFNHTCPFIDKNIKQVKELIARAIEEILDFYGAIEEPERLTQTSINYANDLYSDIEDYFEEVRSTNDEMRKQADYQINELKEQNENLLSEVKNLETLLSEKDKEIDSLNDDLSQFIN